jgi:hypothetical protein
MSAAVLHLRLRDPRALRPAPRARAERFLGVPEPYGAAEASQGPGLAEGTTSSRVSINGDVKYGDNNEDIFGLYIMIWGFHEFKWWIPRMDGL